MALAINTIDGCGTGYNKHQHLLSKKSKVMLYYYRMGTLAAARY